MMEEVAEDSLPVDAWSPGVGTSLRVTRGHPAKAEGLGGH